MIQSDQQYHQEFKQLETHKNKEIIKTNIQLKDASRQIDELKKQLESKRNKAAQDSLLAKAVNVIAPAASAAEIAPNTSTNDDKMFIYQHESGNNAGAINAGSGACGLGQALPCSKMPCSLSDYACQDNWFTNNYMVPRYGNWANAKAFWLAHNWW